MDGQVALAGQKGLTQCGSEDPDPTELGQCRGVDVPARAHGHELDVELLPRQGRGLLQHPGDEPGLGQCQG